MNKKMTTKNMFDNEIEQRAAENTLAKSQIYEDSEERLTLEEAFEQLDAFITELEQPDSSLEDSFRAYEKGMKLVKYCNDTIDRVEKKVLVLGRDGELDEF